MSNDWVGAAKGRMESALDEVPASGDVNVSLWAAQIGLNRLAKIAAKSGLLELSGRLRLALADLERAAPFLREAAEMQDDQRKQEKEHAGCNPADHL